MDVGLGHVGQVVVKHEGQIGDVDAPGGDIGGAQHPHPARLEVAEGLHPGGLALVAVDGGGGDAPFLEVLGDAVGPVLGAGEHQGGGDVPLLHKMGQQLGLVGFVHIIEGLPDGLHRGGHRVHLYALIVVEQAVHQPHHLRGHGGGEEQGLLLLRQQLQNPLYVVDKPHVQHPVRLVQHEDLNAGQVQQALAVEIQQPPRGGHQDVQAPPDGVHLGLLAHAAEDDGRAQGQVPAVSGEAVLDLDGQLPGGGEDERPDHPGPGHGPAEALEDGGCEGAGFAGARLGAAQHVPPRQGGRDGLALDGGGVCVPRLGEGL